MGRKKNGLHTDADDSEIIKSIFNNMPTGAIAIHAQQRTITAINKRAVELLRLDPGVISGAMFSDIFEEKFPGICKAIQETIVNKRPIVNLNLEIENQDGAPNTYLVSTAITNQTVKEPLGIVLVLHDISEVTPLKEDLIDTQSFGVLIGSSTEMKTLFGMIEKIADYDTTVLIYGETGTGKELVARTIHNQSNRRNGPFIPINCSALSSTVLESELFGHIKGAYTGALQDRKGRFEMAKGGTVFLDEIGALSSDLQVKLLRTLQERVVERVGSSDQIPLDIRILSATNQDLTELVARKQFREDLYYRLKVFQINIPPLRSREYDIPILVDHFIKKFNRLHGSTIIGSSNVAKDLLTKYTWPGNVRELENAIEHAMILTPGKILEPQFFPPEVRHMQVDGSPPLPSKKKNHAAEEETIRRTLTALGGNVSKAAIRLDMHRTTLWRKMREFGIERDEGS